MGIGFRSEAWNRRRGRFIEVNDDRFRPKNLSGRIIVAARAVLCRGTGRDVGSKYDRVADN